jgi:Cu(I)/Ag(I) efflux system protein CusF
MMRRRAFLFSALGVTAAFSRSAGATKSYSTRGTLKGIAPDRLTAKIAHEEIPGFMKAMTMAFVTTPALLANLAVGDRVAFTFEMKESGDLVVTSLSKLS